MSTAAGNTTTPGASAHRKLSPRYISFLAAAAVAIVVTIGTTVFWRDLAVELGAIAFFLTYLVIIVVRLPRLSKEHLRAHADESDLPGYLILLIALAALMTAAGSLLAVLNGAGSPDRLQMALGILAVVLGWLSIHTMLGFHYAYEYYSTDQTSPPDGNCRRSHIGGLDFPGKEMPDGLAFLYFSFVVAMTAQVSDVTVTSNRMRRVVLLHGILSFLFNTVIVATAVNIIVALGH